MDLALRGKGKENTLFQLPDYDPDHDCPAIFILKFP